MVVVLGGGLVVGAIVAGLALREGLGPEETLKFLVSPEVSPLMTSPTWIALGIAVNEVLVAIMLVLWLRRYQPPRRDVLPLRVPPLRGLGGALLVVAGLTPAAELAGEVVYRLAPTELSAEAMVIAIARDVSVPGLVGVVLAAAVLPALIEEALFRGIITRAFMKRSQAVAVFIPSLMFGAFHLEPTQAAGTFVLGLGFGLARLHTGSVLTSMICHFVYNAVIILRVHFGARVGDHELHFGQVGLGLALTAVGYVLFLSVPARRSLFPPPRLG
jgi:membrane protease YdiL (CAAX protease family)